MFQNSLRLFNYLTLKLTLKKIPGQSMVSIEESKGNHLANQLAALKQSQPPLEAPVLPTEATGHLKDNIMGAQHLAVQQNRKRLLEQSCKSDPRRKLWVGPNDQPLLSDWIQLYILQYVHDSTYWNTDKMVLWGKQYYWKPPPKTVFQVYQKYQLCPKHNFRRPRHTSMGPFSLPLGSFEVWQMDFLQLSPFQG